jgi:MFS family permease
VADSLAPEHRGLGFGIHRAADTAGAAVGLALALAVVSFSQSDPEVLSRETFQLVVTASLLPAVLSVVSLAMLAREVPREAPSPLAPRRTSRQLGRPFLVFLAIAGLFDLGNFSDAFLILRAQERGLSVAGVLATVLGFNLVYAVVSAPAGRWSDRLGRKGVLLTGWLAYGLLYLGLARAVESLHVVLLFLAYGAYYGLTAGTAKALVADLVPRELRGTAFGLYHALLGALNLPSSLIAGLLWQGWGSWNGFGPQAPFLFGAACALAAAGLLLATPLNPVTAPGEGGP